MGLAGKTIMELRQLGYFVTIAELQNFSRAAAAVRIAQPALSRQIRKLEAELGTVLLHRDGRSAILTEAGKKLYDHARAILRQIDEAKQDLIEEKGAPTGSVAFGFAPHLGPSFAVSVMDQFRRACPKAHLRVVEGFSYQLADWLFTGRLNAALLYNANTYKHLRTEFTVNEDLCLVGPYGDPATSNGEVPLSKLVGFRFIAPDRPSSTRSRVEEAVAAANLALEFSMEVDSLSTIKRLVESGHGHALLTYVTVHEEVKARKLSAARIVKPRVHMALSLATPIYGKSRMLTRTLHSLIREEVDRCVEQGLWSPRVKQ